jgi:hypothetical protein
MSKKKDNQAQPDEELKDSPKAEPKKDSEAIADEGEAIEYVRLNYKVPENIKTVYVTEDKQVFFRANPAKHYHNVNGVKLFTITWD